MHSILRTDFSDIQVQMPPILSVPRSQKSASSTDPFRLVSITRDNPRQAFTKPEVDIRLCSYFKLFCDLQLEKGGDERHDKHLLRPFGLSVDTFGAETLLHVCIYTRRDPEKAPVGSLSTRRGTPAYTLKLTVYTRSNCEGCRRKPRGSHGQTVRSLKGCILLVV
ncbi:hypothetical protein BKA93DRAFT_379298 [Sparassis latifolia]